MCHHREWANVPDLPAGGTYRFDEFDPSQDSRYQATVPPFLAVAFVG